MAPRRLPAATVPALLLLICWLALGGVVRNGFTNYDDDLYLTANPHLAAGPWTAGVRWAFTTTRGGNWHPATWISHLVDVRLFGMEAGAHHAVSLAIHGAGSLVLFTLLRGLTGALWPSALVTALFAVHPLHVESVAWAAERKDVLSTLLAFGAALAYLRGVRRPRGIAPRVAAPLLLALALMAKPMPLSLPLLLLLIDWWPLGRWAPAPGGPPGAATPLGRWLPPWRLWAEKAPLFLLAGASGVVTWVVQRRGGAMLDLADIPLPARAANAAVAAAAYLGKALWPDSLAVLYPYPAAGRPPLAVAAAVALLLALAALAVRLSRRRPWVPVGLLWFLVSLGPVIGIVQVGIQAMADRYTYLPLVGAFLAAAWGLVAVAGRGRLPALAAAGACLAAVGTLAAISARQVRFWRDGEALFTRAVAVTADSAVAHNNLGTALLRRGAAGQALPHLERAVRLAPDAEGAYLNLGRALLQLDRPGEAAARFREAIERAPADPLAHRHLGQALEAAGRRDEALAAYRTALRLLPDDPRTLHLAGVALARAGRAGEAVPLLESALRLDPGNPRIREHLAVARAQLAPGAAAP